MSDLRQRLEPIRSRKYLDGSRGQPCALEFVGVCNHDPETTVACHVHNDSFGTAQKADDFAVIDGCSGCHMFLDHGWVGKIEWAVVQFHIIRGLLRTMRNRIDRGLLVMSMDLPAKPRAAKPKAERAPSRPIQSRNDWAEGRTIPTRPFDRKKERT